MMKVDLHEDQAWMAAGCAENLLCSETVQAPAVERNAYMWGGWRAQGLTGAIHETGHALYEQGRNLEYDGLPVNEVRLSLPA